MEADAFTSSQEFVDVIEAMPCLHVDCVVLEVQMRKMSGSVSLDSEIFDHRAT